MLTKHDYEMAIAAQSACNLSGVVHSFSEVLPRIWEEARQLGKGTEWVNQHPLCILYAEKMHDLVGLCLGETSFAEAYEFCLKEQNQLGLLEAAEIEVTPAEAVGGAPVDHKLR
jgi:hypothetical protein